MNRAYSLLNLKALDDDERTFEGIASTPSIDAGGDSMDPFGAEFTLPIPLLWQHGKGAIKDPVGWITHAEPAADGIRVRGKWAKLNAPASLKDDLDRTWALVKAGLVRGLSIGWSGIKKSVLASGVTRWIKWGWHELSAVHIPMNSECSIVSIKSIDERERRAALGHRAGTSGDGSLSRARDQRAKGAEGKAMEGLNELTTRRDEVAGRLKELTATPRSELAADQVKELDDLKAEMKDLAVQIDDQETLQLAVKGSTVITASRVKDQESGSRARRNQDEDKPKIDPALKGIAFAQYVRVKYLARELNIDARHIADQMKGLDPRVPLMIKAAVAAASTTGSTWGHQLVGDEAGPMTDFAEFLRPMTIVGKFGTSNVPGLRRTAFRAPVGGVTTGATGYWVGEGNQKPVTSLVTARSTLDPLKVATIAVATKESLKYSSPSMDMVLRDELASALIARIDQTFIDPDEAAVANVSPASITNGVSAINSAGNTAANIRTDVAAVMAGFIAANNPPTTGVWIMSATSALSLSLMMNALGQPEFPGVSMTGGTFAGLPVIVSEYVPTSSSGHFIVLVNARDIYLADEGGVEVATSEHATIEMSDNPGGEAGTNVSMFQSNMVAFLAERAINWAKRRPTAVQLLKNVNWGEA